MTILRSIRIILVQPDPLPLSPLTLITKMQRLKIRFEFLGHTHDLHDVRIFHQYLSLLISLVAIFG